MFFHQPTCSTLQKLLPIFNQKPFSKTKRTKRIRSWVLAMLQNLLKVLSNWRFSQLRDCWLSNKSFTKLLADFFPLLHELHVNIIHWFAHLRLISHCETLNWIICKKQNSTEKRWSAPPKSMQKMALIAIDLLLLLIDARLLRAGQKNKGTLKKLKNFLACQKRVEKMKKKES